MVRFEAELHIRRDRGNLFLSEQSFDHLPSSAKVIARHCYRSYPHHALNKTIPTPQGTPRTSSTSHLD